MSNWIFKRGWYILRNTSNYGYPSSVMDSNCRIWTRLNYVWNNCYTHTNIEKKTQTLSLSSFIVYCIDYK